MIPARRTALLQKCRTRERVAQYFFADDAGEANSV